MRRDHHWSGRPAGRADDEADKRMDEDLVVDCIPVASRRMMAGVGGGWGWGSLSMLPCRDATETYGGKLANGAMVQLLPP